jgi:hypothetical protein
VGCGHETSASCSERRKETMRKGWSSAPLPTHTMAMRISSPVTSATPSTYSPAGTATASVCVRRRRPDDEEASGAVPGAVLLLLLDTVGGSGAVAVGGSGADVELLRAEVLTGAEVVLEDGGVVTEVSAESVDVVMAGEEEQRSVLSVFGQSSFFPSIFLSFSFTKSVVFGISLSRDLLLLLLSLPGS